MAASPTAKLVTVTPELAQEWLADNKNNRILRDRKVKTYAEAITAGDWQLTGETVKFDSSGRLIDGQHRLHAVVHAGLPVKMFVVAGVDAEAQLVIDTGMKRTPGDAVRFAGYSSSNNLASLARNAILWETGAFKHAFQGVPNREVTNPQVVEWIDRNDSEALEAIAQGKPLAKGLRPMPLSVAALVTLILRRVNTEQAAVFTDRIIQMQTKGTGDPIHALVKRYRKIAEERERVSVAGHLFIVFRAWNAWRDGQQLRMFRMGNAAGEGNEIPTPH